MVDMTLHGKDLNAEMIAFGCRQRLEPVLYTGDIEDLPSVAGTEYKVIVDQGHCCLCSSIFIIHVYIVSHIYTYWKLYLNIIAACHPTTKVVGFLGGKGCKKGEME